MPFAERVLSRETALNISVAVGIVGVVALGGYAAEEHIREARGDNIQIAMSELGYKVSDVEVSRDPLLFATPLKKS